MRHTIRNLMLSALFVVLIGSKASAQGMPVYDNTNFISFVKSLLESGKQTANLMKTLKFLKTQKENIDKVNNVIKQLQAVRELARNNQRLFDVVQDDLREILNSPFIKPNEVTRISDSFDAILQNSMAGMEYIDQILSSDNLKMTDAERAEVLKEKELESKEMVAEIEAKTRRYREIIQFREMQYKINNRETDY
ncbi:conjugal transfer protein [Antarcticibacterium flavum]|uniref:Conjugal transfer protein n=2 Tax=Antarcticibacterium flavum TaxID=2058175 RepID=A0A5B7X0F1_9FLAO|nr:MULTISPECIES: conjugal transfer protein [Antarcticibacterium]MCM4158809.1 conjugal transfer protein [Antarcticibacterium sp. W02-3]QCY68073.1 conjugal transfer protein [Antarcticibacterium flavum]